MPTSELSNALNLNVTQTRHRPSAANYATTYQPIVPAPQQYVPHRSELELAISEPPLPLPISLPPPPPPIHSPPLRGVSVPQPTQPIPQQHPNLPLEPHIRQPSTSSARPRGPEGAHLFQELLRLVSSTRDAQEAERIRRMEWERRLEEKQSQQQAELERRMLELSQDLGSLKSVVGPNLATPFNLFTPQYTAPPIVSNQVGPPSPISPSAQTPTYSEDACFGSSVAQSSEQTYFDDPSEAFQEYQRYSASDTEHSRASGLSSPSLQPLGVQPSELDPQSSTERRRKRPTSDLSSDEDSDSDNSDSSSLRVKRPLKRQNNHDKRCLTIQHAMRAHIMRLMQLDNDKDLPDSHPENIPLGDDKPIRFVWDKTSKQSFHNSRMKSRVLADLRENRTLYKHVPDRDFGKKALEGTFDQAFTTLRQKFKAQRDAEAAISYKKRENQKAQKARHLSRRKIKLSNRSEARKNIPEFEHVVFDGALQLDCMSSEESEFEQDSDPYTPGILRTRGYLWRSKRLTQFYCALDDEERADRGTKPKRGIGRRERCIGPPKDGFQLPPKGVSTWMISKRWINSEQVTRPDLLNALKGIIHDLPGFDWDQYDGLGEESDDESRLETDLSARPDLQMSSYHYHNSDNAANYYTFV